MAYDELIERFDRHMVRIDEELRLSREAAARHAEMYDRHAEMYDRHAGMFDDTREFIREMTLRIHRGTDAMVSELRDQRDATRANTQAVLRMLDRMGPAPDPDPDPS